MFEADSASKIATSNIGVSGLTNSSIFDSPEFSKLHLWYWTEYDAPNLMATSASLVN